MQVPKEQVHNRPTTALERRDTLLIHTGAAMSSITAILTEESLCKFQFTDR
jgi:hypothetical protein